MQVAIKLGLSINMQCYDNCWEQDWIKGVFLQTKEKVCGRRNRKVFFCKQNEKMFGRENKTSALLLIYDVGDLVL